MCSFTVDCLIFVVLYVRDLGTSDIRGCFLSPIYECLDTCCSHFLTIIAGVDLHFRHESELHVCRTRVATVLGNYTNDAGECHVWRSIFESKLGNFYFCDSKEPRESRLKGLSKI